MSEQKKVFVCVLFHGEYSGYTVSIIGVSLSRPAAEGICKKYLEELIERYKKEDYFGDGRFEGAYVWKSPYWMEGGDNRDHWVMCYEVLNKYGGYEFGLTTAVEVPMDSVDPDPAVWSGMDSFVMGDPSKIGFGETDEEIQKAREEKQIKREAAREREREEERKRMRAEYLLKHSGGLLADEIFKIKEG